MNTSKPDSNTSTHTLNASKSRRASVWTLVFVLGISFGLLLGQFQRADGTFSVQAGLDFFAGKAGEARIDDSTFSTIWERIHEAYVTQPVDDSALLYSAVSGMVAGLGDPYSVYFNPDDAKDFLSEIHGEFSGVGAQIDSKDGYITVVAPQPESPAEKAGIRAGDRILFVDGVDVSGMSVSEVVDRIRGDKGTTVKLTLWRVEMAEPFEISIVRDTIQIASVKWEWLQEKKIAHIAVSSFSDDTVALFADALGTIVTEHSAGVIIDLRNNPGGYLQGAVDIASTLLDKGSPVLYEQHADGTEKVYSTEDNPTLSTTPIVVLVNEGSASAAEILAGALKDHNRAVLIGTTTFGKGSVQEVKNFSDGSLLKLTIAHWLTPNRSLIQDTGVAPHYIVDSTEEDSTNGRDPQLDAAQLFLTDRSAFDSQFTENK
ncbi:MAG: S41 family peptidase [Candidatus Kerfeldbacteria bacterium]|nr:S41 family peptidase [Candidatus Kerfeldbacteria bacterium]